MNSKHFLKNGLSRKLSWILMGAVVGFVVGTLMDSTSAHAISTRSRFEGPSLEDETGDKRDTQSLDSGYLEVKQDSQEDRYILWPRVTVGIVMQDASGNLHLIPLQGDSQEDAVNAAQGSNALDRLVKKSRGAALSRCMDAVDDVVEEQGGLNSGAFLLQQGKVHP